MIWFRAITNNDDRIIFFFVLFCSVRDDDGNYCFHYQHHYWWELKRMLRKVRMRKTISISKRLFETYWDSLMPNLIALFFSSSAFKLFFFPAKKMYVWNGFGKKSFSPQASVDCVMIGFGDFFIDRSNIIVSFRSISRKKNQKFFLDILFQSISIYHFLFFLESTGLVSMIFTRKKAISLQKKKTNKPIREKKNRKLQWQL